MKTSQVNQQPDHMQSVEKSEKKMDKKADEQMESLFEDFLSKKISKEKQTDQMQKEKLHQFAENRLKSAQDGEQDAKLGLNREDEKGQDRAESTQQEPSMSVGLAATESSAVDDPADQQDAAKKLESIVQHMVKENLSQANMMVTVTGQGGASLHLALSQSKGQMDVFISSQSQQAIELVSNQLSAIQSQMQDQGHNVHFSIVT